jgi:hypothetical protein
MVSPRRRDSDGREWACPECKPCILYHDQRTPACFIGREGSEEKKMAKLMPIGARAEAEETVEFKHTLTAHHELLPPVYSTPDMIRLIETAAFLALHPYCEDDEITVGTSINIEHRAASGIGIYI